MFELLSEIEAVGLLIAIAAVAALVLLRLALAHLVAGWPWRRP